MHNEIYRIAYQLNAEGKTPSVALIRSRLTVPTSLPVIVQGLQHWKNNPELGKEQDEEQTSQAHTDVPAQSTDSDTKVIALMQQRIATLERQVAELMKIVKMQNN